MRGSFLLLGVCGLQPAAHAQLTNGCFTIGGTQSEIARTVVQTSDGGYAIAGATNSYTGDAYGNGYVVKTDAYGAVEWNMGYGDAAPLNADAFHDIIQTSDGGYAIAGASASTSMGLMKLDAAGAVVWSKRYETDANGVDNLVAVMQTADGGYVLAGTGDDTPGFDKMVVIKTDAAGGIEWSKSYANAIDPLTIHEAFDVVVAAGGGYALCGYWGGFVNRLQVLRLDDSGDVLWAKSYGDNQEYATAMAATPDSGFVVVGRTNTYGFAYINGTDVYHDGFAVKLDKDGGVDWAHAYGNTIGTFTENFLSVAITSDGGYAMCGEAIDGVLGVGAPRIYVVKCDANGGLLWSQRFGYHQAQDIVEYTDGGLAMACNGAFADISNGTQVILMKMEADGTICPDCMPEAYGSDSAAVLVPVDFTYVAYDNVATSADYTVDVFPGGVASGGCLETGVDEPGGTEGSLTISPNPARDICTISLDVASDAGGIEVTNSQGAVLMRVAAHGRSALAISLDGLAPGLYILRTTGGLRTAHTRLVVAR